MISEPTKTSPKCKLYIVTTRYQIITYVLPVCSSLKQTRLLLIQYHTKFQLRFAARSKCRQLEKFKASIYINEIS